jgi:hypothetical protein
MTGNWTFVWPTVYIAHHSIVASVTWGIVGEMENYIYTQHTKSMISTLLTAGVFAINSNDVYSMHPLPSNTKVTGMQFASLVAEGKYDPSLDEADIVSTTKLVDFGMLNNPVPASVYFADRFDCWGKQSHCATITDDSYHPTLSIRYSAWKSNFPHGFSCRRPILVDPPIDLSSLPGEVLEEVSFPRARRNMPPGPYELPEQHGILDRNVQTSTREHSNKVVSGVVFGEHNDLNFPKPAARIGLMYPQPTESPRRREDV